MNKKALVKLLDQLFADMCQRTNSNPDDSSPPLTEEEARTLFGVWLRTNKDLVVDAIITKSDASQEALFGDLVAEVVS